MIQFLKGRKKEYSKHELFVLKSVMEDALYFLKESWTECETYGEKNCKYCYCRHACRDIKSLIEHINAVENSVKNVEN